ncbi:phosphoserine phosphatase SerB [Kangiella marina]
MDNTSSWLLLSPEVINLDAIKKHFAEFEFTLDGNKGSHDQSELSTRGWQYYGSAELRFYQSACQIQLPCSVEVSRPLIERVSEHFKCDYCLVKESLDTLKAIKLAVFDMDSTLIPMEVIDELAAEAGVKEQVAEITEAAMRGELDFDQSFEKRLLLLKGMPVDAVNQVKARLTFNPGVETCIRYLSHQGATVAVASGGFIPFAKALAHQVPISKIHANTLDFEQGRLTGNAMKPILNAAGKAEQVKVWQSELVIEQQEILAVGDGANDSLMLKAAGLGVAYKAKPYLRQQADCVIQFGEMDGLIDVIELLCAHN